MSILIKDITMPKDGEFLDLVITADGKVASYDAEDRKIAEAVEFPDHALIWGTKADGIPVLMFIQPESKEEKSESEVDKWWERSETRRGRERRI